MSSNHLMMGLRLYIQSLSSHHKCTNHALAISTLPSSYSGLRFATWNDIKSLAFLGSYAVTNKSINHLFSTLSILQPPIHLPRHDSYPIFVAAHLFFRRLKHLSRSISNLKRYHDPSNFTNLIRHLQHKTTNSISKTRHEIIVKLANSRNKDQLHPSLPSTQVLPPSK